MAHGYAKIEGKPASSWPKEPLACSTLRWRFTTLIAIRVPILIIGGNIIDATKHISQIEWTHSVQDAAAILRDYVTMRSPESR